jgi:hypothetical protein
MNFWIRLPMNWEHQPPFVRKKSFTMMTTFRELRKQFCKTSYRVRSFESFDW